MQTTVARIVTCVGIYRMNGDIHLPYLSLNWQYKNIIMYVPDNLQTQENLNQIVLIHVTGSGIVIAKKDNLEALILFKKRYQNSKTIP